MVLRWFKDATDLRMLARDGGVSVATAYRYVHEGIDVIAAHGPDLHEVLDQGLEQPWAFVCLDGTLIGSTRPSDPTTTRDAEVPGRTAAQVAAILSELAPGEVPSARTLQRHFARPELNTRPDGSPPAAFGRFEAAATSVVLG